MKRGFINWHTPKSLPALIVGLVLIALGIIPLLNQWGVIGFGLPGFLTGLTGNLALYIVAAGGFYLLINAFFEFGGIGGHVAMALLVVALITLAIGIIPLLHNAGMIGFTIPFLTPLVFKIIFVIEGIFLIVAAFTQI